MKEEDIFPDYAKLLIAVTFIPVVIASIIFMREKIHWIAWLGAGIAIAGSLLLSTGGSFHLAPGDGLWLWPCRQVHTFGMRFPIDAVLLDLGEPGAMDELRALRAELAEVVTKRKPGRLSADEITIFDSTGTALQDVACAALAFERAGARHYQEFRFD